MRAVRLISFAFVIMFPLIACAADTSPRIYPPYQTKGWRQLDYRQYFKEKPIKSDQAMDVINLDRTATNSFHLVRVQTREPLHVHRKHDGTAILLEGKGTLVMGKDHIKMLPGDVVTIPRKVVHTFINEDKQPSAFYVIYSPPFDGKDRVVLQPTGVLQKQQGE